MQDVVLVRGPSDPTFGTCPDRLSDYTPQSLSPLRVVPMRSASGESLSTAHYVPVCNKLGPRRSCHDTAQDCSRCSYYCTNWSGTIISWSRWQTRLRCMKTSSSVTGTRCGGAFYSAYGAHEQRASPQEHYGQVLASRHEMPLGSFPAKSHAMADIVLFAHDLKPMASDPCLQPGNSTWQLE